MLSQVVEKWDYFIIKNNDLILLFTIYNNSYYFFLYKKHLIFYIKCYILYIALLIYIYKYIIVRDMEWLL